MSGHDYIHRQRWWSWDDAIRQQWTDWFAECDLSINDIKDFHVYDHTVTVNVYSRNKDGDLYLIRDNLGSPSAAIKQEHLATWGRPPVPDAEGTRV